MRSIFVYLMIPIAFLFSSYLSAKEQIIVGLTSVQPPFVLDSKSLAGLAQDLVQAMNEQQDHYQFKTLLYPAKRLLESHQDLNVHLIAFNDLLWGWKERQGQASLILTEGRDVFVQKRGAVKEKTIKDIVAVRGFHYAFAEFNTEKLHSLKNIMLVSNESSVIEFVDRGRANKGIVSEAYLNWLSVTNNDLYDRLEILETDHAYHREFIVFPYSSVSKDYINELLINLREKGLLEPIFAKYGMPAPPLEYRVHAH